MNLSLFKLYIPYNLVVIMLKCIEMLIRLRFRNRHQLYAVLALALFSLMSICAILNYNEQPYIFLDRHTSHEQVQQKLSASIEEEKGLGCEIPKLDPFAKEMMEFNMDTPKVKCDGVDWVECYRSECSIKKDVLAGMRDVVCIYKDIIYVDDSKYVIGDPVKVYDEGSYLLNRSDHVKVSCSGKSLDGIGLLPQLWHGYKAGFRPIKIVDPESARKAVNVMILCFDSTSHNGFRRRMPLSYKVLSEELDATILQGYNIIGDGTSAAIIPLLSGKTELELPDARIRFAKDKLIDPEHFIFRMLRRYGYRTAYFEDMPWIGTFQYRYNGFEFQPADHYLRAFFLEESKNGIKWWNGFRKRYCVGALPQYGLLLNLSKQFTDFKQKHFGFTFIADISHDNFNMISTSDDDVVAFLRHFKESGKFSNHLVIVMGDHGPRYNAIRETYQGKLEERLPLMAIILSETLKQNRPEAIEALRNNALLLTTPFDIHTTILAALELGELSNNYSVPGSNLPRGLSLLEPIPKTRTCGQAGVLSHWCVCSRWHNISPMESIYDRVADTLASFINNATLEVRSKCMKRKFISVEWVMRHGTNDDILSFQKGSDWSGQHHEYVTAALKTRPSNETYQAKIVMGPGRAVFEGTMIYDVKADQFIVSEGDISRITAYGDESKCISATHPHLNKFCFCKGVESKILVVQ